MIIYSLQNVPLTKSPQVFLEDIDKMIRSTVNAKLCFTQVRSTEVYKLLELNGKRTYNTITFVWHYWKEITSMCFTEKILMKKWTSAYNLGSRQTRSERCSDSQEENETSGHNKKSLGKKKIWNLPQMTPEVCFVLRKYKHQSLVKILLRKQKQIIL